MGCKEAESAHKFNQTFVHRAISKSTAQHWFQKCPNWDKSLKNEEISFCD